ncbi:partner of bursicon-like [Acanthaster planci]|uniref:Partner of bursicon-like n=1 Tax=Acanthaster planci TaxID=133434 RepID=A0A8B7XGT9_ACAPL|nr:partner of bursicon-like [Acanthaster planci]
MECAGYFLCLLVLQCLVPSTRSYQPGDCNLSFQSIEIQKDVVLASGQVAVCFGTATASSCHGACPSFTASSIYNPAGLTKKCTCCREKEMITQSVILSPCFDPNNGEQIVGEYFMDEFQQPSGCECQPCTL